MLIFPTMHHTTVVKQWVMTLYRNYTPAQHSDTGLTNGLIFRVADVGVFWTPVWKQSLFLHFPFFCQDHYCQRWLTISIQFGLAVWFCSDQELPAHPCSLAWMRAGRAAMNPQGKQNRTNKCIADIIKVQSFYVHILELVWFKGESEGWILTDRGGVGDGGG